MGLDLTILIAFALVVMPRSLQLWEWGLEIYGILTFWTAYEYGLATGLGFTILSSILVIAIALSSRHHFLNHSFAGPFFQSIDLMLVTILGGMLGHLPAPVAETLMLIALGCVAAGRLVHSYLASTFIGLPWIRLIPAIFMAIAINYNLLQWLAGSGYLVF